METTNEMYKIAYLLNSSQRKAQDYTHIVKLLYIAEIISIDKQKKRFTAFDFKHYKFGPMIENLDLIMNFSGMFDKDSNGLYFSKCLVDDIIEKLSCFEKEILDAVIKKWDGIPVNTKKNGNKSGLLGYIYNTIPFITTGYNEVIKFERFFSTPHISKIFSYKNYLDLKKKTDKNKKILDDFIYNDDYDGISTFLGKV